MSKNKKILPIVAVVGAILLVLVGGLVISKIRGGEEVAEETGKKKTQILEPKNIIDVAERPYVKLTPVSGGHHINIEVDTVKKDATEVEYELEYQSGTLLQGFQEVLDLAQLPASTKKLLGSQSAGGAITYHEDIKGGSLQLRFLGAENYVVKQDWKYFDNKEGATAFSSKDAKFQIESEDLEDVRLLVIYNTPGYPEGLEGELVSEPYFMAVNPELDGVATISIRASQEASVGELMMMGYDGAEWVELESTVEGKVVTAKEAQIMELYLVVEK